MAKRSQTEKKHEQSDDQTGFVTKKRISGDICLPYKVAFGGKLTGNEGRQGEVAEVPSWTLFEDAAITWQLLNLKGHQTGFKQTSK